MKQSRFTQEQILGVLKKHQAGALASDLCRKHGVSDATIYTWRSKYGGMDARKLKGLEEENAKLKRPSCPCLHFDRLAQCAQGSTDSVREWDRKRDQANVRKKR